MIKPLDIAALEALYQEVRTSSYPYVHGDRRWELLQHFPKLIKAVTERGELKARVLWFEDRSDEAVIIAREVDTTGDANASLRALLAEAGEALEPFAERDGEPAAEQCRRARTVAASIQSALRDASPTTEKPE